MWIGSWKWLELGVKFEWLELEVGVGWLKVGSWGEIWKTGERGKK